MKTEIINQHSQEVLIDYNFTINLHKGDFVNKEGIQYIVTYCGIEVDENILVIMVE